MKTQNKTKKIVFIMCFIIFLFCIYKTGQNSDYKAYKNDIEESYVGVVERKYFKKTIHIEINIDGKMKDFATMSPILNDLVEVGDTIYKIPNKNECILRGMRIKYTSLPAFAKDLEK